MSNRQFQSPANKKIDNLGFTILEIVIGTALLAILAVGVATSYSYVRGVERFQTMSNSLLEVKTRVYLHLTDDQAIAKTIADPVNKSFACLRENSSCLNASGPFRLLDRNGNVVIDPITSSQNGLTFEALPCSSFDAVNGNRSCPVRVELEFSTICTAPCLNPLLRIIAKFNYSQGRGDLSLDTNKLNFTFIRPVTTLIEVGDIATTARATYAIAEGGRVLAWGDNRYGRLGIDNDTNDNINLPTPMIGSDGNEITNVVQLSDGGSRHGCLLVASGEVLCWGDNTEGEIGIGSYSGWGAVARRVLPVVGIGGAGVLSQIRWVGSGGGAFSMAIDNNDRLISWGNNQFNRMGFSLPYPPPIPPLNLSPSCLPNCYHTPQAASLVTLPVEKVAVGYFHTCAILKNANQNVICWGRNDCGQLGDGTYDASGTSCSLLGGNTMPTGGTVFQVDPTNPTSRMVLDSSGAPLEKVIDISSGNMHTCALTEDGSTYCWGRNIEGQGGADPAVAGNMLLRAMQVKNTSGTEISQITSVRSGEAHNCAIQSTGEILCWGSNSHGQLGRGYVGGANTALAAFVVGLTGKRARDISLGYDHSCALFTDGTIKCWGSNERGQLGMGESPFDPGNFPTPQDTAIK